MLEKLEKFFDTIADYIGYVCSFLMIAMMLNIFYDVFMRYLFKSGSIAMQEMEWHLFSVIILLGTSYALKEESHVRVDVLYTHFSEKKKALINIIGVFTFIMPIALLIALGSVEFVMEAFGSHEISGDPGGLTHRWILKAFIPASFWLLIFMSVGYVIKNINLYKKAVAKEANQ
ncbi:MAG: TRAP transporter small permease subunit [Campylobacteraceae bacterium]|nr:TRAP transporter small permease subunit [Campylobacteraceae bacterium]